MIFRINRGNKQALVVGCEQVLDANWDVSDEIGGDRLLNRKLVNIPQPFRMWRYTEPLQLYEVGLS